MSVAARVLSGSLAAWSKVAVTALTQIALVPIFLTAWSVEQYGCWLVIQSVTAFVNIFSLAHHTYVGNEFLRVPAGDPARIGALLSAALPYSLALGFLELCVLGALGLLGYSAALFDPEHRLSAELLHEAAAGLAVLAGSTFVSVFSSGLYGRVAGAYGHYPRTAWWGVAITMVTAVTSAVLVWLGAGLFTTAAGVAGLNFVMYALYHRDVWQLGKRHHVVLTRPDWNMGWRNLLASLQLGLTYLLWLVRQQGTRILVSSTLGVAQAVAFTTMRTVSNLSLQGIGTVVDPVFPEFMGFLRDRNRSAVLGTFAFIWLIVVFVMGPVLVLLQVVAPELFAIWTQGKVPFDPVVFALFSVTMMVFALARPADSIILGNNLLRVQLVTAASLAATTVIGIVWLDGLYGTRGIVVVLLAVEVLGATVSMAWTSRWLSRHALEWPRGLFRFSLAEVLLCSSSVILIALEPQWRVQIAALTVVITVALLTGFVSHLPPTQRDWLRHRIGRLVFVGKRI
jgi:O-antigen/teichoic acid export membrane protein